EREQVISAKTRIKISQVHEAVDEKPGPDQENERDRDLRDDERAAEALPADAGAGIAAAFFQGVVQIEMRRLTSGGEAEDESGDNSDDESEHQHLRIDRNRISVGGVGRNETAKNTQPAIREQQTNHAAEKREHHAFDQKLFREARAIRAERKAERYLFVPHRRARQQEIRDVRARDQEHEGNRA